MNHIRISPIKLRPISFESASPSTRFPATDTTIIAKEMPVRLLITELDSITPEDKDEMLNNAATIMVTINAHIIGSPIRAYI